MAERAIEIQILDGLQPYAKTYELQRAIRDEVDAGTRPNTLLLLEHEPVITLGRDADEDHLLQPRSYYGAHGIEVLDVDRGGDVTYHGPGQLTAYPILRLSEWRESVRWYLRSLEEVLILTLAEWNLEGVRNPPFTGVWVRGAKIAQVGIAIRNWVSYHGIALNISPNMAHFGTIIPCGIPDKPITSMAALLTVVPEMGKMKNLFGSQFVRYFEEWVPDEAATNPGQK